jgi:hypothetical protein
LPHVLCAQRAAICAIGQGKYALTEVMPRKACYGRLMDARITESVMSVRPLVARIAELLARQVIHRA